MNVKMIVVDLDQTLLKKDKSLSDYSAKVLREFGEKGKVVIASGRAKPRIDAYSEMIQAHGVVAMNGAVIYDHGEKLKTIEINPNHIKSLINELLALPDANLSAWYPSKSLNSSDKYTTLDGPNFHSDFKDYEVDEISKVTIFTDNIDEIKKIDFEGYGCKLLLNAHEPNFFVVVNERVNKISGIQELCKAWQIDLSEVVAFGDDYNDVDMLKECGKGVVVANAPDSIKEIADELCLSNEEDGVAHWIEENCL